MPRKCRTPAYGLRRGALSNGAPRKQRDEPATNHLRRSESRPGVGHQRVFRTGGDKLWTRYSESVGFTFGIHGSLSFERKKTDVSEHPKALEHVGLLVNRPPGTAELPFI